MEKNELKQIASWLRKRAIELAHVSGKNGAHLGGGLSAIEIFATLYGGVLNYDPLHPLDRDRDRLVVSKGHCVLAYYAALEYAGFLSAEDTAKFETNGSPFHGHATRNPEQGIEFSGGSLSMGMSFSVGVAVALKKSGSPGRVFTVVGDGECNEGLIWEAAMSAAQFKLNNLVVIVDCNNLQYDGTTESVMSVAPLASKFRAFGFEVKEVDGHDCKELAVALGDAGKGNKPMAVIANTIKGKGVSFMENKKEWHHGTLSELQYQQAIKELEG